MTTATKLYIFLVQDPNVSSPTPTPSSTPLPEFTPQIIILVGLVIAIVIVSIAFVTYLAAR